MKKHFKKIKVLALVLSFTILLVALTGCSRNNIRFTVFYDAYVVNLENWNYDLEENLLWVYDSRRIIRTMKELEIAKHHGLIIGRRSFNQGYNYDVLDRYNSYFFEEYAIILTSLSRPDHTGPTLILNNIRVSGNVLTINVTHHGSAWTVVPRAYGAIIEVRQQDIVNVTEMNRNIRKR